jgi:hypothetical protein
LQVMFSDRCPVSRLSVHVCASPTPTLADAPLLCAACCAVLPPGSAITGPVAKECADLWPRIASAANSIV